MLTETDFIKDFSPEILGCSQEAFDTLIRLRKHCEEKNALISYDEIMQMYGKEEYMSKEKWQTHDFLQYITFECLARVFFEVYFHQISRFLDEDTLAELEYLVVADWFEVVDGNIVFFDDNIQELYENSVYYFQN